jgi:hypothetical protein
LIPFRSGTSRELLIFSTPCYACARFQNAEFYARRERGAPAVIAFEAKLEDVAIDGKDLRYTVLHSVHFAAFSTTATGPYRPWRGGGRTGERLMP